MPSWLLPKIFGPILKLFLETLNIFGIKPLDPGLPKGVFHVLIFEVKDLISDARVQFGGLSLILLLLFL
jgi:hypothetical protein